MLPTSALAQQSYAADFQQMYASAASTPHSSHQDVGGHASQQQFTDLSSVFLAMSVQPPCENNYYMDSRASLHMSFNRGAIHSLTPCNANLTRVGNNYVLPVYSIFFLFLIIDHT